MKQKLQFVQIVIKFLVVSFVVIAGWVIFSNRLISKPFISKPSISNSKPASLGVVLCRETPSGQLVSGSQTILPIFKKDGSLQCKNKKNNSLKIMTQKLKNLNIKIIKSSKGYLIGGRKPSVCAFPTNRINIFYVPSHQTSLLLEKGFKLCIKPSQSKN